jgi:Immunity protein 35
MAIDLVTNLSQNLKKISEILFTLLLLDSKDKFGLLLLNRAERASFLKEKMISKQDIRYLKLKQDYKESISEDDIINRCVELMQDYKKSISKEDIICIINDNPSLFKSISEDIINDYPNLFEDESKSKKNVMEASNISVTEAKIKATEEINKKMGSENICLAVYGDKTVELASGWIFHYDSEKYIRTGERKFMICGNYPIFISKRTQKVYFLYPGVTLDGVIEEDKK